MGALPCAGPGNRVTGMSDRITRASHRSGHSTNQSAGANKIGCPQLCKALLPASVLQTEGPYSLLKNWMQKVCKTFYLIGQRRNGPTNLHLQVQNAWKKRKGGKEGKRDRANNLNCDFFYLWRRPFSNFLLSLKKINKSRQKNMFCRVLT